MAFSLGDGEDHGMNEMNLIPLIDIMLVLMIIFLVTATVVNPSVPLTLPKTSATVQPTPPEIISISITEDNQIMYDHTTVSLDQLKDLLHDASLKEQKPSIQLRAHKESIYDTTAQVMATASEVGLSDIAFVHEN